MVTHVHIVTSLAHSPAGPTKDIVKVFGDKDTAEAFREKMQENDEKLQKETLCDPTEYSVKEWPVEWLIKD